MISSNDRWGVELPPAEAAPRQKRLRPMALCTCNAQQRAGALTEWATLQTLIGVQAHAPTPCDWPQCEHELRTRHFGQLRVGLPCNVCCLVASGASCGLSAAIHLNSLASSDKLTCDCEIKFDFNKLVHWLLIRHPHDEEGITRSSQVASTGHATTDSMCILLLERSMPHPAAHAKLVTH